MTSGAMTVKSTANLAPSPYGNTIGPAPTTTVPAGINSSRGICSITTASGNSFRFRTNPNSIKWKYTLNTHIDDTYGGRVIQILSARIEDLEVVAETGWAGWDYMVKLATFMRDFMNEQRNGKPGTFQYTTRNWNMKVFAVNAPFTDTLGRPNKTIRLTFNVVEDTNGALSSTTISAALAHLQDGIGYTANNYNMADPSTAGQLSTQGDAQTVLNAVTSTANNFLSDPLGALFGTIGLP